jgi:MFS transporter, putative metabolite:H+ symporter
MDAVTPAFLFLAACGLAIGLAFTLLDIKTYGRPLALDAVQGGETAGTVVVSLGGGPEGVAARPMST